MAEASPDIVAMGEPMFELAQVPGEGVWRSGFGGDTSCAAIAAARSGTSTGYLTAVGKDAFGEAFRDLWAAEWIDTRHVETREDAHTGVYFIGYDKTGHHFSYLRTGSAASRMTPADVPAAYVGAAKVLHISGISLAISASACDACFAAIRAAKAGGARVSLDTNFRPRLWPLDRARAVIHAAGALADICRPSLDDARHLTGLADADAIADFYLRLGAGIVALTLGADGALIATPERRQRLAPFPCKPVDATAAGDVFDGAFLGELLRTGDPFEAGRYANAAAALTTEGYGAVTPIPHRAQVLAAITERVRGRP
jgi:2-dehydro-3-deoxygluconokinase